MIKAVTFHAEKPGPHLLVLGAVHGNEKCGTVAIERVCEALRNGTIQLEKGQLTFVPICNPRAYAADVRFTERNLNRYLVPMEVPNSYEAQLGNALCPMLAACDVLLDIHSYTVGGAPFVVVDSAADETERAFVVSLGAEVALFGWQEAYAASGKRAASVDKEEATGTTQYARRHGARAVTLECGQHKDPEAPQVAYRAIHNALRHLEMVVENRKSRASMAPRAITMTQVYYHDDAGSFSQAWRNFDRVKAGAVMGIRANGEKLIAPQDGVIIMPKANFAQGEEWFYFGTEAV